MTSNGETNSKDEKKEINKMDLDTILVNEIGEMGRFQLKMFAVAIVVILLRAWAASEYVFTTGRINTRCYVEGCDTDSSVFTPEWVWGAVGDAGGAPASCQRYANISALPADGSCPAHLFNSSLLQPCDSYVYENTNTVVYDFDLGCDEWSRSVIGFVRMAAMFVALPFTGYISDRWGRRVALIFNVINAGWTGIIRYWINNYIVFLVSVFMETVLSGGVFSSFYILAMEMVGPRYRVKGAAFNNITYSMGQITMAFIAMAVPNWRMLILTLYIPQFLGLATVFVLSESVRWSMSKGYYEEAETLLKKIAKINKRDISDASLEGLRHSYEEQRKEQEAQKKVKSEWLVMEVIRNKGILLRCCVSAVNWITSTLVFHGLSINATILSGNQYINYAAAVSAEIPGYLCSIYLVNKLGRKPCLVGAFFACAACQVAYIFVPKDLATLSLTIYLIGKFMSAIMVFTLYIYTVELFPTQHRHKMLAFSSFMGRFGSIVAPLTPAFSAATFDEMPFVLFGSFALLSGFMTMLLPETLNIKLPDTMQEAENLGKPNKTA